MRARSRSGNRRPDLSIRARIDRPSSPQATGAAIGPSGRTARAPLNVWPCRSSTWRAVIVPLFPADEGQLRAVGRPGREQGTVERPEHPARIDLDDQDRGDAAGPRERQVLSVRAPCRTAVREPVARPAIELEPGYGKQGPFPVQPVLDHHLEPAALYRPVRVDRFGHEPAEGHRPAPRAPRAAPSTARPIPRSAPTPRHPAGSPRSGRSRAGRRDSPAHRPSVRGQAAVPRLPARGIEQPARRALDRPGVGGRRVAEPPGIGRPRHRRADPTGRHRRREQADEAEQTMVDCKGAHNGRSTEIHREGMRRPIHPARAAMRPPATHRSDDRRRSSSIRSPPAAWIAEDRAERAD